MGPMMSLYKVIAQKLNSSVISENCANSIGLNFSDNYHIFPHVNTFPGHPYVLDDIRLDFPNFSLVHLPFSGHNFAYCESLALGGGLLHAGNRSSKNEVYFWIVLLSEIILASLILNRITQVNLILYFKNVVFLICALFSTLIDKDIKVISKSFLKKSIYYIVISRSCFVLSNYYLASVTSFIVRPPQRKTMTKIGDVFQNNYSLLFPYPVNLNLLNASVEHLLRLNKLRKGMSDVGVLGKLLDKDVTVVNKDGLEFGMELAFRERVVLVDLWNVVMAFVNFATEAVKLDYKKDKRICHVGQQLMELGEDFQMYSEPANHEPRPRIGKVARALWETGIYQYWFQEFSEIRYATRVQDRIRVKGRTKIKSEFETPAVSAIKLTGGFFDTFYICIFWYAASVAVFLLEFLGLLKVDIRSHLRLCAMLRIAIKKRLCRNVKLILVRLCKFK